MVSRESHAGNRASGRERETPTIAVSACLLGCRCRYDGQEKLNQAVLEAVSDHALVPVCPELLAGFGVPRVPISIRSTPEGRRVVSDEGIDVTGPLMEASRKLTDFLLQIGCSMAICKERSPSCGVASIYVDGLLSNGAGLFASMLRERGINLFSDEEISDRGALALVDDSIPGPGS